MVTAAPRAPHAKRARGRRRWQGAVGERARRKVGFLLSSWLAVAGCARDGTGEESSDPALDPALSSVPSGCPMPADADAQGAAAVEATNRLRKEAGLGCVELVAPIALAAGRHCQYYVSNAGSCVAEPHREQQSCSGFTGTTFSDRLRAASYGGRPMFEVMAYVGSGERAVQEWLGSIWHRLPLLSPRVDQAGYALSGACDTMDFGNSGASLPATVAHYPFANQASVPLMFEGGRESPAPPPPPDGWPSGFPVTVWAAGFTPATHALTVAASGAPVDHMWLTPSDRRALGLLDEQYVMYAHRPLLSQTRYRVHVTGTRNGAPADLDWTFTTR
jgi:uncharacterized protein YkwD